MTDIVIGLGEIGKPIKQLLFSRGVRVTGLDIDDVYVPRDIEFMHVCIPYSKVFLDTVSEYQDLIRPDYTVIHSTVKPNTSKLLGAIYSPVRGIHSRMLDDLKRYKKYYSGERNEAFEKRFAPTQNVPNSTVLENTKIMVDTTYYGFLIAYRKMVDFQYEVDWSFADEINEHLHNRPVMYNNHKPIGGHCVMQNLDLIDQSVITRFIKDSNITTETIEKISGLNIHT